ncbi:MAG: hypothetical protein FRX49_09707 [Trebouxia sp. A1-2]|nr:MAG: hypothetical protein FRX49_09707 [Trebouxia sp. A1-2]
MLPTRRAHLRRRLLPSQLLQAAPDDSLLQSSPQDALPEGCNPALPKGFQPSHTHYIHHKILVRQLLALGCLLILECAYFGCLSIIIQDVHVLCVTKGWCLNRQLAERWADG